MPSFFVRVGALAEVSVADGPEDLRRGDRVVLRSQRGLEVGEVLTRSRSVSFAIGGTSTIVRLASENDEALIRRLSRHKRRAIQKCRECLRLRNSHATLLDIDHLFDGRAIVLHFLGEVDRETESLVRQVAEDYESIVRTNELAKLLREGCGENCGTEMGAGCGSGCAGCAVSGACGKGKAS